MTRGAPRVAILLPNLHGGGAERMRVQLATAWLELGIEVEFVLLRKEGALLASVPPQATVVELGVSQFRDAIRPLVGYLRSRRPTVLLAALWPLTVIAVLAGRLARVESRVVVSEHAILSLAYASRGAAHRLLLRSSLAVGYRFADARIGVSRGTVADVSQLAGMSKALFQVVHNPAAGGTNGTPPAAAEVLAHIQGPLILSVGTLKAVKNHALLIDAFAKVNPALEATLCILGEGSTRGALEQQIRTLGLRGRVLLPGFFADTRPFYARANAFVLSSNHEGFGNVLVEALEYGLPIVSTDCPAGPREILDDGKYGQLVPVGNADALCRAIVDALRSAPDRERLKARAREFLVETVARRYVHIMLPGWLAEAERTSPPAVA